MYVNTETMYSNMENQSAKLEWQPVPQATPKQVSTLSGKRKRNQNRVGLNKARKVTVTTTFNQNQGSDIPQRAG